VRRRYWQSRSALRQWLAGMLGCAASALPLHSPPGRPPLLLEGAGWVSLSHSGEGLLLGFSRAPIGVDLEPADRPVAAAALMRRCFPVPEVVQLQAFDAEQRRTAVLTSWVLKEAAIKWRRRSLASELSCWQLDHASGRLRHQLEGLEPECGTGTAAGWRWAGVGAGMGNAGLDVVISGA
jgi:4'-phosphopantetheinyl transferase